MKNLKDIIEKKLIQKDIDYRFISLPLDLFADIESNVRFHNIEMKQAVPTLIFKTENGLVAVQRRADTKFDSKKLRQVLNVKNLRIASKEELQDLGLETGYVPLIGLEMPFYIDKKVLDIPQIYGGGGSNNFSLRINPTDLINVNQATVVDVVDDLILESGEIKRVFSGTRATGRLHLGNYFGAVKGYISLADDPAYECIYMAMDLHTVTTPYDHKNLAAATKDIIIDYLAAGLDPKKAIITVQSLVPEHTYLAFLFSSATSIYRMQHLPTFKDKVRQHPQNVTMALLNYPVLMAADILVYKAGLVPVGIDQEPHLEVSREIARKMNDLYGTDFPEPQRFATKGEYIPSLSGEGKMSKSVEGSYINLSDSFDEIHKKIRAVPTATVAGGKMSAGVKSLFTFINLLAPTEEARFRESFENNTLKFVELKDFVTQAIFKELEPFRHKRKELEGNPDVVEKIIKEGAQKAREIAGKTLEETRKKMGLIY